MTNRNEPHAGECPKAMRFGPCGGVHGGDRCEVDQRICPFISTPFRERCDAVVRTPLSLPGAVIVDVRAPFEWDGDRERLWERTATAIAGCIALLGEHVDNPALMDDAGPTSPLVVVEAMARHRIATIATVTGRDRNLGAAESHMRALRNGGALAIHCVTGDHPAALGLDRQAWFGCESVTLASVASRLGFPATVGESPSSPGHRVERLLAKERSGATLCILNQCGNVHDTVDFVDRCRAAGVRLNFAAAVPMVGSLAAAVALDAFPGLRLPDGLLDAVANAKDPFAEGLRWSVDLAARYATSGRFVACNLSGRAPGRDPFEQVDSTHVFATAVRAAWNADR